MIELDKIKEITYGNDENTSIIITTEEEQFMFGIDHEFIKETILKNYSQEDIEINTLKFREKQAEELRIQQETKKNMEESKVVQELFSYKDSLYTKKFILDSNNTKLKQSLRLAEDIATCNLIATLILFEALFDQKIEDGDYDKLSSFLTNAYDE